MKRLIFSQWRMSHEKCAVREVTQGQDWLMTLKTLKLSLSNNQSIG